MKVKFINSKLQYVGFVNLINHSECVSPKYIKSDGTIGNASDSFYYISNKIPFTEDISCNRFYTSTNEQSLSIATAVVRKNSDDSIVRVIQFTNKDQWVGVAPNIVWNEETDTDTYIILSCTIKENYKLEDWKAVHGSYVFKSYITSN